MTKKNIIDMLSNGVISIDSIRLSDYSEYDADKCHDGGYYGFWETYTQTEACSWVKSYGSTASLDFDYCPCCGCFYSTEECNQCDGTYEYVSINELIKILDDFNLDDDHFIDITFKTHKRVRE